MQSMIRKPIVCRFVRRLAKEMVISLRKNVCRVNPAAAGSPEDSSLSAARTFDHLSPGSSKKSIIMSSCVKMPRLVKVKDIDDLRR